MSKHYTPAELKPASIPDKSTLNTNLLQTVTADAEVIRKIWDFLINSDLNTLEISPKEIVRHLKADLQKRINDNENIIIFISCNWYDKGKAPIGLFE